MINKNHQLLTELISRAEKYFMDLSYSNERIRSFRKGWNMLDEYMKKHTIELYSSIVGEQFIQSITGESSYDRLTRSEKNIVRSTNVLTEYQTTGTVKFRSILKTYEFKGEIGDLILSFLSYRKSIGFSKDTLDSNRLYLHRFLLHLEVHEVVTISGMNKKHIMDFINSMGFYSKATMHCMLSALRNFLKYLRANFHTLNDFSFLVPKSNYKNESSLPTTYEKDEVERLIQAVDCGSPKGKRDMTMILLAARLGLRASDICGLKFENIHWETNSIVLIQQKTKEKIELPLLTEIGNAIIDYLRNGRPVSDLPYIFIHSNQPYGRLAESTLHSIVSFYLRRAGINNVNEKKHGPHALRHSLAGFLLEKKTPLPVISDVLGHANTETTKTYLRIDLSSLRQCALEVPQLDSPYYREVV